MKGIDRQANIKTGFWSVLFFIACNAIFWVAAEYIFIDRALLNVDYLIFIIISCVIHRYIAIFAFLIFFVSDIVMSAKGIFYFKINELSFSLPNIPNIQLLKSDLFLVTLGVILLAGIYAFITARIVYKKYKLITFLVVLGCLISVFDAMNGTNNILQRISSGFGQTFVWSQNIGTSQFSRVVLNLVHQRKVAKVFDVPSASEGRLVPKSAVTSADHQMLVIVESWGLSDNPLLNDRPLEGLLTPAVLEKYSVTRGQVPFSGTTTSGEMRELCGVNASFVNAGKVGSSDCLPGRFAADGYDTYAFHGFTRTFFYRQKWYPLIGFEHLNFAGDDIDHKCGVVFRGECDTDILTKIADVMKARRDQKTFAYFLTLNTHLPNDKQMVKESPIACDDISMTEVCTLVQLHYAFFSKLGQTLADPDLPPMHILLVGDHAPPFAALESREQFSKHQVPFLELVPK
ncbi:sulfatase-like hydrolase/transferase [Thalassospira sp. MA62]|nr:sulfatase-like hydrolase/transferase [Thalassospira sp. MA62]